MRESWLDRTEAEAARRAAKMGLAAFRGRQIWEWLHARHVFSYEQMTNLPKDLRQNLSRTEPLETVRMVRRQASALDETVKYLFELEDGCLIESVLMKYHHGYTVCVSSQVGCRMGCRFCASTLEGLERNLTAGEMLLQIYTIEAQEGIHVSNTVIMGCGEPFDNYDAVLAFLRILHEPKGQNMSYRSMTVSTCGLIEPLKQWIREDLPVTLAISLHAPNDAVRRSMMPVANSVSMEELLTVCREYTEKTNRRITFEYALVQGSNDSLQQADELADRLEGMLCHVNLIPVNPVAERGLNGPQAEQVRRFEQALARRGVPVSVRRELGRDIDGACGQLRRRHTIETEAIG